MSSKAQSNDDPQTAAAPEAGVTRMMSVGLAATIERFNDPALLKEGKINLISLDAVVLSMGTRWPLRRDQIYAHVDRTLERRLGLQGYHARISETDFLICQPELGRFSGQAACLRFLREILTHFLGEATYADTSVHQVMNISAKEIDARQVDAGQAEREEEAEQAELAKAAALKLAEPAIRTIDQWSPFVAADGREVRVSCTLEPVFELKTFGRIGFRMARRVVDVRSNEDLTPAAVSNLSRADILRIDLATVARGMGRLQGEADGKQQPSLIVPVSFISLSNQRGRDEIVLMLKEARSLVKSGVICEICEIEGVPQGALLAASSLIRTFSLFVVGRLYDAPPAAATVSQMKGAGLQAMSVECPNHQGEAQFLGWAKATIDAAKQITKSVLVYRADSPRRAGMAALLGATHASVRP